MAELFLEIEDALGAPVIEGVTAAVKWVEALVALRLATAKRGDYARPLAKRYDGDFAGFSPTGAQPAAAPSALPQCAANEGLLRVNANALRADSATADIAPHIHSV
jgi:allantoin racemase